ncbi:MAG TPA: T9SS type B sorting domain-containing protein [Bacteroidetes bacterium]|nr:T9SS type B sorting domain-containing protein [Bacteroidota bacterium]
MGFNSGQVCIYSVNECGSSQSSCLYVNITDTIGPLDDIIGATAFCSGVNQSFYITPQAAISNYTWSLPSGSNIVSGQGTNTIIANMANSGSVQVTATNDCDTVFSTIHNVSVYSIPNPSFTTSNIFCIGDTIFFTNTTPGSIVINEWLFGDGSSAYTQDADHVYSNAGNYTVSLIVLNDNGCRDTLNQSITVSFGPVANFNYENHCHKDTIFFYDQSTNGPIIWSWNFDNLSNASGQNSYYIFPALGSYDISLSVTDVYGCIDNKTSTININESPSYTISPMDTSIVMGEFISFNVSSGIEHIWSPSYALDDSSIINPTAQPLINTTYYVISMNEDSCLQTDTINVEITDGFTNFIATAFTPNGDGKNDYFTLRGLGIKDIDIKIFNRWGESVFESSDLHFQWDGTNGGSKLAVGTYAYMVIIKYYDNTEINKKGSINLFR